MNEKSLKDLIRRLREMRRSPQNISSRELVAIATQLGRELDNRGKEPTYVRSKNPMLSPPLSIPNRTEVKVGTARSIIDQLIDDADEWTIFLNKDDDE